MIKDPAYRDKVREQIRQFEAVEDSSAQLSDAFRYWQNAYFFPRLSDVCGVGDHIAFYERAVAQAIRSSQNRNIVSFGSGDAQIEVAIAASLMRGGVSDFLFHCVEISPIQIERAKKNADKAGLGERFVFTEADINTWTPTGQRFAAAMAHHALHHVVALEHLAEAVKDGLAPEGVFVCFDLIGRNGHMRWPEALAIIERIWRFLPPEKKRHHILQTVDEEYQNRDCSTQGFEGIRSQDILPVLMNHFGFETFFAFGNLIDVFTSGGYGANFDVADGRDKAFIDFIQYLNDLLIDLGHIKPTRMAAVMVPHSCDAIKTYKNWTPAFCARRAASSCDADAATAPDAPAAGSFATQP
ncbi:MAG: methyltransferase domain-containing protein [Nitrospinae bacterium]|nr:methyltransferase domain-containing protein [Nitrospinota bacterium]